MFVTAFQIDNPGVTHRLGKVLAAATDTPLGRVRVVTADDLERSPRPWFVDNVDLGIQITRHRGDFPAEVEVFSRAEYDQRKVLERVARELDVTILTDQFDVNPLADTEWLMISPDGSSAVVYADGDEFGADDPAIILEPESRAVYEAKRIGAPSSL
jgi:hypothetical protein